MLHSIEDSAHSERRIIASEQTNARGYRGLLAGREFTLALVFVGSCDDESWIQLFLSAFAAPPPLFQRSTINSLTKSKMLINFILSPMERRSLTEVALHPVSERYQLPSRVIGIGRQHFFLPSDAIWWCEPLDYPNLSSVQVQRILTPAVWVVILALRGRFGAQNRTAKSQAGHLMLFTYLTFIIAAVTTALCIWIYNLHVLLRRILRPRILADIDGR